MRTTRTNRRRLTLELSIGGRWWLLPLAAVMPLLIFRGVWWLANFSSDDTQIALLLFGGSFATVGAVSSAYVAALLNCRGAKLRHRAASICLLLAASLLLSTGGVDWIGGILGYTAAVAVLVAASSATDSLPDGLAMLIPLTAAVLVGAAGQCVGALRDVTAAIVFGIIAAGTLLVSLGGSLLSGSSSPQSLFFLASATFFPPWAIGFLHRRRTRQPVGGASGNRERLD